MPFPYSNGKKFFLSKILPPPGQSAAAAKPSLTAMLNTPLHVPAPKAERRCQRREREREAIAASTPAPAFFHSLFHAGREPQAVKRELTSKALARMDHRLLTILH
ncbi:hypothetical protein [uncultured Rhodoblastus sp.]|uniref:hypothetical protein n=1 Tax=uncultured Rhodoblastus sp. TaxID=543037 RepID=UPI0025F3CEF7|nr:hypothetical protein [uncultured Rhodoblastus sp.]